MSEEKIPDDFFIKAKKYIITRADISSDNNPFQPMLGALKKKGAPVLGLLWMNPDYDNYKWISSYEPEKDQYVFYVKEKDKS